MAPTPIDERLRLLHEHYTWQINAAVAEGRMDLVSELTNNCEDEALALMLAAEGDTSKQQTQRTVETLELGGWPHRRDGRKLAGLASRFRRHSSR
jgi:hypothetical protein